MNTGIIQPAPDQIKTQMYLTSPYARTMFQAPGAVGLCEPEAGFALLDRFDLVLIQHPARMLVTRGWIPAEADEIAATTRELGTTHFMRFNTDVVFFGRSPRVEALMNAWHSEWLRWKLGDELALMRAINNCPVRIAPLRRDKTR